MSKLKFTKNNNVDELKSVDDIMLYCEQYRNKLIKYCSQYFDYEYEYAEDCVQSAYVALLENLNKGIEIRNYYAWLFKVLMNHKDKIIKEKFQRNEYDFDDNEEKDRIIENTLKYEPDYIENMISDKTINERATIILSSLNENEKALYLSHYIENKNLK